jgi:hypothetical protein
MYARIGAVIFLVFLCSPPIAQAAILNGGFESGLGSEWNPSAFAFNSKSSASATLSSETGHLHYAKLYANSQPDPMSGVNGAYAQISQTTTANAGDILTFDYYSAALSFDLPAGILIDSTTTGQNIVTEAFPGTSTWTPYQITLPTSDSYNIQFIVGGQPTSGESGTLKIDNVSITSVPEPGVMSLLGFGALTCGLFAWRRRR